MTISKQDKAAYKDDSPFWNNSFTPETFAEKQEARLSKAKDTLAKLLAVEDTKTVENTLEPYDEIRLLLNAASYQSGLIENVHPDKTFRETAEEISQKISAFYTELSLNKDVFDAIF